MRHSLFRGHSVFFLQLHNRSFVGGGGCVMFLQKAHIVFGDYRPHVFHTG